MAGHPEFVVGEKVIGYLKEPLVVVRGRKALCVFGLFIFLCSTIGVLFSIWQQRVPPFELLRASLSPDPVEPGQDLHVAYTVKINGLCNWFPLLLKSNNRGISRRFILDSTGAFQELQTLETNAGTRDAPADKNGIVVVHRVFRIPTNVAEGTAIYQPTITWDNCNPFYRLWPLVVNYHFNFDVKKSAPRG